MSRASGPRSSSHQLYFGLLWYWRSGPFWRHSRGCAPAGTFPNHGGTTRRFTRPAVAGRCRLHVAGHRAFGMSTVTLNFCGPACCFAIRAAIIAAFSRLAVASRVRTFFVFCHEASARWTQAKGWSDQDSSAVRQANCLDGLIKRAQKRRRGDPAARYIQDWT
jgi:hypothetical protein